MEKEKWKTETIILREVRLGFPNLFNATVNPQYPSQKPAYSAQFEIVKGSENEKILNDAIVKVVKELHGAKADKKLAEYKVNKMKYPVKDGDDMDKDWAKGKVFLTAKVQKVVGQPKVIEAYKVDDKFPAINSDDDRIVSGAIVTTKVVIGAQPGVNDGVRCQLQVVQYLKAGEGYAQDFDDSDFEEIDVADNDDGLI
jgi:hypothetical protein